MGKSGCGKTSMRSLIFSSYKASDTRRLGSTLDVEHSHVRFLGNLVLNLWDCGGQQSYMDSYLDSQRQQVFSAVGVLIYVFDLTGEESEWGKDVRYFKDCLSALQSNSPEAGVFCLLHKMDLVDASRRKSVYASRVAELKKKSEGRPVTFFPTSIWDETLYRAWSLIVHALIPNIATLERHLAQFARICSAAEVVLFEKSTFLVISRSTQQPDVDSNIETPGSNGADADASATSMCSKAGNEAAELGASHPSASTSSIGSSSTSELHGAAVSTQKGRKLSPERFEKISELIKNLKSSCAKLQAQFQGLEIRGATYTAYLDLLTTNTYVMVIVADPRIQLAAIKLNVELGREHFEKQQAISTGSA
ncbi:hypothetical protein K437DRAFT_258755 [Tilletiaria anomala UBC 951]|uniref:GTP-binding protein n=1 Tax=Tilletiaria anomala (strain ATCC 24038 / CBS 436.72 / UBC 951) TaxID=1037660 RepID=A0A066VFC1_TILAU|nr:uncharacterized protein K437DRAFT_258755 [Tilletiaria anomala UBC 951]KDN40171.1 hypothetical protein K437DRAFT_258755 [Tilletiaria anomala UBC 951]